MSLHLNFWLKNLQIEGIIISLSFEACFFLVFWNLSILFCLFFAQAPDLLWETKFIELGRELDKQSDGPILSVDVSAVRR
mgnify:CR=1 FL=1